VARSIYIASPNAGTGKSTVALGLVSCLTKVVAKVGVFRPFVESREGDAFLSLLLNRAGSTTPAEQCVGATWDEFHADPEEALARIVDAYRALAREHDVVIIDGSDFTDVAGNPELALNARVAANIGVPVLLVVSGQHDVEDVVASDRSILRVDQLARRLDLSIRSLQRLCKKYIGLPPPAAR